VLTLQRLPDQAAEYPSRAALLDAQLGQLRRFTNVDTGTSTTLGLKGRVDVVPTAHGGSIRQGSGITVFVFFPGDAGSGDTQTGRTDLFAGNFVATSDPSGA
jgi:hypothetical protein